MNRAPRVLATLVLTLLAGVSLLTATAHAKRYIYSCVLTPAQEAPTNATTGSGGGRFVIDTDANTVDFWISYAGLSSAEVAAHIHGDALSSPGHNAGVLFNLPAGNPKVGTWNYSEAQEPMILAGLCYANIHTTNNPGGEMRGQIVPLNAVLDQAQEFPTPPVASAGKGWMTATIDTVANTISYYLSFSGLTGPVTGSHFHGSSNYTVPSLVKVALTVASSPTSGTIGYNQADEAAILSGLWYVNLHTTANPAGEIRGQLTPVVEPMDWTQETPPTTATGSAGYVLTAIDTASNTLGFDVHVLALSGAETAAHIHGYAPLGANAGVLLPLAAGPRKIGTWTYPAANEADVLLGRTYINSHTAANPNGEIRAQMLFLPGVDALLGVGDPPHVATGLSAAPNPFGSRTSLTFQLARTGTVSLSILSVDGRLVRHVQPAIFAPGPHSYTWDGLDDGGRAAAPGVYFAVVRTPDGAHTTRLARLN